MSALDEKPQFDYATELAKARIVDRITFVLADDGERVSEMWEDYPEIGENDWIAICEAVKRVTEKRAPSVVAFNAAYKHLAGRADRTWYEPPDAPLGPDGGDWG